MPVTGHNSYEPVPLTVPDIRTALRDFPEYNLLEGEQEIPQFTDDEIERAIRWAIRFFNGIPPTNIAVSREAIPEAFHYTILQATLAFLLRSAAMYQLRNQTNAPEGVFNKFREYYSIADAIEQRLITIIKDQKIAANKVGFFGDIGSGYRIP